MSYAPVASVVPSVSTFSLMTEQRSLQAASAPSLQMSLDTFHDLYDQGVRHLFRQLAYDFGLEVEVKDWPGIDHHELPYHKWNASSTMEVRSMWGHGPVLDISLEVIQGPDGLWLEAYADILIDEMGLIGSGMSYSGSGLPLADLRQQQHIMAQRQQQRVRDQLRQLDNIPSDNPSVFMTDQDYLDALSLLVNFGRSLSQLTGLKFQLKIDKSFSMINIGEAAAHCDLNPTQLSYDPGLTISFG